MTRKTPIAGIAVICILAMAPAHGRERLLPTHSEDFSGASSYDESFWRAETGFFRNREAQYYTPGNVEVRDGMLSLVGRRQRVDNAAFDAKSAEWPTNVRTADYTSGSIVTRDSFRYGAFEIVARLPQSPGVWPAIWTIWEEGAPYREIDIVEAVGVTPGVAFINIHAGPDLGHLDNWKAEKNLPDLGKSFHAWRLDWRPDRISISIDGHEALRMNPEEAKKNGIDPLREEMRLRINLALGGSWGGKIDDTALPARLEVKSIKVWRLRD